MKKTLLLYGAAGSGKTITALSILKDSKYKIRILALDANALAGIQDAIRIHNIKLIESQLIVAIPTSRKINFSYDNVKKGDSSDFTAINAQLNNFTGIDLSNNSEVQCGSICDFDENTVFIIDSFSTWQDTIRSHATKILLAKQSNPENGVNGMSLVGEMQNIVLAFIENIQKNIKCHFILVAHEAVNGEEALAASKGTLKTITPNFPGVKNTAQFLGKFAIVLYCKYLPMSKKYIIVAEDIKDIISVVPRYIPKDKNLKLSELIPDLTNKEYLLF